MVSCLLGAAPHYLQEVIQPVAESHFTTSTAVIIFICSVSAGNALVTEHLPSLGLVLGITYQNSSLTVRLSV